MSRSLVRFLSAAVVAASSVSLTPTANAADDPVQVLVTVAGVTSEVHLGDQVAQGAPLNPGACDLPVITVEGVVNQTSLGPRVDNLINSLGITLLVDQTCGVTVQAIDEGKETSLVDPSGDVSSGGATLPDVLCPDVSQPLACVTTAATTDPVQYNNYLGETTGTVLEQFNITAYQVDTRLWYKQDVQTGQAYGSYQRWECYNSAFPGNRHDGCGGDGFNYGSGASTESQAWGHFYNTILPVNMSLQVDYVQDTTGWYGVCEMPSGSLPPTWEYHCAISRGASTQ